MIDAFRVTLQNYLQVDSYEEDSDEGTINPPTNAKPFDMEGKHSIIQYQQRYFDNGDYGHVIELKY